LPSILEKFIRKIYIKTKTEELMRRHLRKIRKTRVTKEELKADIIFLLIAAFISFVITFLFDIHHSFYQWPFSLKFIFNSYKPYLLFVSTGTIIIFIIIKLLLYGMKEEKTL